MEMLEEIPPRRLFTNQLLYLLSYASQIAAGHAADTGSAALALPSARRAGILVNAHRGCNRREPRRTGRGERADERDGHQKVTDRSSARPGFHAE